MILVLTVSIEQFLRHGGGVKHGHAGLQSDEFIPPEYYGNKVQQKLSTLRYRLFAMGGYMVKEGNRRNSETVTGNETQGVVSGALGQNITLLVARKPRNLKLYCVIWDNIY